RIYKHDDGLVLENEKIKRTYKWNGGDIITTSIVNKEANDTLRIEKLTPDLFIPGVKDAPLNTKYRIFDVSQTDVYPYHKCIEIIYSVGTLDIKRVLRLYPGSPAIASDYYFKGKANILWTWDRNAKANFKTKESLTHSVPVNNIVSA